MKRLPISPLSWRRQRTKRISDGKLGHAVKRQEQIASKSGATPALSYARTLSWLSLLFILLSSLGLSFFIASSVRETLLRRQEDFTRLLVENLNSQIFRRFALPTLLAGDGISLRQPSQHERLDSVVRSVIEGLPVERLRIFDFSHRVAYSTDKEELGKSDLAPANIDSILEGGPASSRLFSTLPPWKAWFHLPLDPGTFSLRVLFPLRGEPLGTDRAQPVMGALELTQDITDDYERVMAFQGIIVVMCLLSSVLLFGVLLLLIQRSERVLAERILRNQKLENELHSNEKLVSMGRVVASIAHEIRNPLGIIRSSAELLQRRQSNADKSTRLILQAIYDESVRLSRTVNDFLDYARPRKPAGDLIEPRLVLEQVLAFLEEEFRRHDVRIQDLVPEKLWISGDKDLLYRAFYNILVNAQQALNGPGEIVVTGEKVFMALDAASPDDASWWVMIKFMDNGPGFDPKFMENILDPFFTTKEGGTGLGLPIVNSIIQGHGGQMRLSNREEGGAIAAIYLPAAPEAPHD